MARGCLRWRLRRIISMPSRCIAMARRRRSAAVSRGIPLILSTQGASSFLDTKRSVPCLDRGMAGRPLFRRYPLGLIRSIRQSSSSGRSSSGSYSSARWGASRSGWSRVGGTSFGSSMTRTSKKAAEYIGPSDDAASAARADAIRERIDDAVALAKETQLVRRHPQRPRRWCRDIRNGGCRHRAAHAPDNLVDELRALPKGSRAKAKGATSMLRDVLAAGSHERALGSSRTPSSEEPPSGCCSNV